MDLIEVAIMMAKILGIFLVLMHVPPIMVWVERRGSALIQNRLGPNRIGPLGLLQSAADAIKMLFKEDSPPGHVNKFYYLLAPVVSLVPAFMAFAVIPFASSLTIPAGVLGEAERVVHFQIANLNIGMLYVFSIASLGVYGIIMGSWASNSKYALFGGLRSTAQMVSYELTLGLSVIGLIMAYSSIDLNQIVASQGEAWLTLGPLSIPKWGVFIQPLGFLLFITAAYAETNRLPFDLPEGESEIVAGYHLEYGTMKFGLFMLAEYVNMFIQSAMITTLYFGGWQLLPGMHSLLEIVSSGLGLEGLARDSLRVLFEIGSFAIKTIFFLWLYVWVRWTLPRFRYDQLMAFGWKTMLPLALVNIFITGALIYFGVI